MAREGLLILGVGREGRGDDAVGPWVIALLRSELPAACLGVSDGGTDLLDLWGDRDTVVLVDAVLTGATPGSLLRWTPGDGPLPVAAPASSHGFGLAEVVELARALGALPADLLLLGIEAAQFEVGAPLDARVEATARGVAQGLVDRWKAAAGGAGGTCTNMP